MRRETTQSPMHERNRRETMELTLIVPKNFEMLVKNEGKVQKGQKGYRQRKSSKRVSMFRSFLKTLSRTSGKISRNDLKRVLSSPEYQVPRFKRKLLCDMEVQQYTLGSRVDNRTLWVYAFYFTKGFEDVREDLPILR